METAKKQLEDLIKHLPEDITWDEIAHKIYVRHSIERGLKASREGNVLSHKEALRRLGIDK